MDLWVRGLDFSNMVQEQVLTFLNLEVVPRDYLVEAGLLV